MLARLTETWSKNLGHEQMLTTFRSYGSIDPQRQGELIRSLGAEEKEDKLDRLMQMVERMESGRSSNDAAPSSR